MTGRSREVAVIGAVVAAAMATAAAPTASAACRTYALVHGTACEARALRALTDALSSRKLESVAGGADLTVDLRCVVATDLHDIGGVRVPESVVHKTVNLVTRYGSAQTLAFEGLEVGLNQFLQAHGDDIRIEPVSDTMYRVVKPVAEEGQYTQAKDLSCLAPSDDVLITAGEFSYSRSDARGGVLSVAAARDMFYRIEARPDTWPRRLPLWLCLGLSPSECAAPDREPAAGTQTLIGRLTTKRLTPLIAVTGFPREGPSEQVATLSTGKPYTKDWQIDTDFARMVDLRLGLDRADVRMKIAIPLPFWAPLIDPLPSSWQRVILENYPQSLWFAALMLVALVVASWLTRERVARIGKQLFSRVSKPRR